MSHSPADMSPLPVLDTHAHIAPDIIEAQVRQLGDAVVFAMTRTLEEAEYAIREAPAGLVWAVGVHPGRDDALKTWDAGRFAALLDQTFMVGEVGLDSRGDRVRQRQVFEELLAITASRPCILSIHSQGRVPEVLSSLESIPQAAPILHWFNGTQDQIAQALELGAYFSINGAMSDELIRTIPIQRCLPETDFPSSRKRTGAQLPGDIRKLEESIGRLHGMDSEMVRRVWYRNLSALASSESLRRRVVNTSKLGAILQGLPNESDR